TPLHEAGYTDAVVHRFEIKTNTGKPGGVHIRITAERLSAISAGYRRMTPLASCALRSYRDFALSVAYVEQPQSGYPPFRLGVGG
ncbi:hypothetical protein R4K20_30210, partial [Pseudomonas aeruginosa]